MITGATGFAGSSLVDHYLAAGWNVFGTYRESTDDLASVPEEVNLRRLDLGDRDAVSALLEESRPDLVHHLAAQSSVAASWSDPMGTLSDNAGMQFNVLEATIAACPQARVVVVGSCDEYGNVALEENPVDERHELRPANPYSLSKVVQDLMGLQYAERGLDVVRVRPFLQLGPRRARQFVAGSFASQVAEIEAGLREPVIEVGNVDIRRDFTDVRDVARAYSRAADSGLRGEVYNIASGSAHSLRELLTVMLARAGVEAEVRQDPTRVRAHEAPLLLGDATRLRAASGWEPIIPFERSVADTLDWWRDQIRGAVTAEGTPT